MTGRAGGRTIPLSSQRAGSRGAWPMLGEVVRKAGEGAAGAVAGPTEGLAEQALGFLLSPWGLGLAVVLFLVIRWIR